MNENIQQKWLDLRVQVIEKIGIPLKYFDAVIQQFGHEPIVGYLGGSNYIVLNDYGALVLCTSKMLIVDIDLGDCRLDGKSGGKTVEEVVANLKDLPLLDATFDAEYQRHLEHQRDWNEFNKMLGASDPAEGDTATAVAPTDVDSLLDDDVKPPPVFAKESYRVYQTTGGVRVICTSVPIYYDDKEVERLLRFLRADPEYAAWCKKDRNFRARSTRKPFRDRKEMVVCQLVTTVGSGAVHPQLAELLEIHDAMTLTAPEGTTNAN